MAVREREGIQHGPAAVIWALCALGFAPSCWAQKQHFDIPSLPFFKACEAFRKQATALEIVGIFSCGTHFQHTPVPCENMATARTKPIRGDYEPEDALRLMAEGSGIEIALLDVPGGAHREREIVMRAAPPLRAVFNPREVLALVGDPDWTRTRAPAPELAEVLVLGTHIRGVSDIAAPLSTVKRDTVRRASYGTVQDVLRELPFVMRGGPNEEIDVNGNVNRASSINLRGLGPGATLVLVNGRRQPTSGFDGAFVDVSNIPWSAVDHVDVLPDGASALYGSDAIAGVVNIVLQDRLEGAESQLRLTNASGGAAERLIAQSFGHSWQSGHWLASYQYSERTALPAAARAYAANSDKRPLGGSDHSGIYASPGNMLDPMTLEPRFAIVPMPAGSSTPESSLAAGAVNTSNRYAATDLLPDRHLHSLYVTGSQRLSEHIEAFAEARFARQDVDQHYTPAEQILAVPPSNPFFVDPFGNSAFVPIAYRFDHDLGPMTGEGRTDTMTAATTGVPGTSDEALGQPISQAGNKAGELPPPLVHFWGHLDVSPSSTPSYPLAPDEQAYRSDHPECASTREEVPPERWARALARGEPGQ